MHLVVTVGDSWLPLAAQVSSANQADNQWATRLLDEVSEEVRYLLGDTHYNDQHLRQLCEESGRVLIATHKTARTKAKVKAKFFDHFLG